MGRARVRRVGSVREFIGRLLEASSSSLVSQTSRRVTGKRRKIRGTNISRRYTQGRKNETRDTRVCTRVRVYMEVTGDRTSGFTGSLTRRSGCYVVDENRRDIYSTYAYKYVLRACTYVLVVCLFVREGSCVASANSLDRRDVCASLLSFSFLFSSFIFALPFPPFYFLFRFSFPFFPPRFTFPRTNERTVIYPWRDCFPYGPSNLERTVEEEPGPVLWEHTRLNTCVSLPAAGRKSL